VRRALAYTIDRGPILEYLWRGFARPAASILPTQSWAYAPRRAAVQPRSERARQMLDDAGYRAVHGVRFHLTIEDFDR